MNEMQEGFWAGHVRPSFVTFALAEWTIRCTTDGLPYCELGVKDYSLEQVVRIRDWRPATRIRLNYARSNPSKHRDSLLENQLEKPAFCLADRRVSGRKVLPRAQVINIDLLPPQRNVKSGVSVLALGEIQINLDRPTQFQTSQRIIQEGQGFFKLCRLDFHSGDTPPTYIVAAIASSEMPFELLLDPEMKGHTGLAEILRVDQDGARKQAVPQSTLPENLRLGL